MISQFTFPSSNFFFRYVGNLHKNATESVLKALFAVIGNVVDVKMINDAALSANHYCFITYETHICAQRALAAMNGREVYKMPLKVNWATRPDGIKKDTSSNCPFVIYESKFQFVEDHHIFVGDLAQELTTLDLQKEFEKFGDISEARVVRDAQVQNCFNSESYRLRPTDQKDTASWRF